MPVLRLSRNAIQVLEARYLKRDRQGKINESPEQMFERVARAVAYAELIEGNAQQAALWEDEFYKILTSLDFVPNSPTLMNAGTTLGQLSACFVLPVPDSIEGIFESVKQMALIQRTGGGTGFSFSNLRPKDEIIASTGGHSSGPVSFMKIFDCATENIKQGGKRRGANMGILRVDHPDIMEFIQAKLDGVTLQNFNISVGVTNAFMEAVHNNDPYDLVNPLDGQKAGSLSAKEVFKALVDAAWHTGDPGLIFLDTINSSNPTPHLGSIAATNPCGEIPLLPYESCNLGSVNLAHMLIEHEGERAIYWEKLRAMVSKAVRFLDDVITVSRYPLAEIEKMSHGNRKIGLGAMGFADMLIKLGIPYDSDDAVDLAEKVQRFISEEALKASQQLADKRGVFPNWKGSIYEAKNIKVRNAARTAIAPTGTISIVADTTASIEPLFALAYRRVNILGGETQIEVNPFVLEYLRTRDIVVKGLLEEILKKGHLKGIHGLPPEIARLFVTALDISADHHLLIQAAFQRHIDNSVSKTINLPTDATPDDIEWIYQTAWEFGLKGVTIFRYGSKSSQVLELGLGEEAVGYEHSAPCDPGECGIRRVSPNASAIAAN
ncbi:MAG: adenosylcobalamin-dependent ribonucleoside-diphosphate reductase [Syntrophobacteraceae bacterium]